MSDMMEAYSPAYYPGDEMGTSISVRVVENGWIVTVRVPPPRPTVGQDLTSVGKNLTEFYEQVGKSAVPREDWQEGSTEEDHEKLGESFAGMMGMDRSMAAAMYRGPQTYVFIDHQKMLDFVRGITAPNQGGQPNAREPQPDA